MSSIKDLQPVVKDLQPVVKDLQTAESIFNGLQEDIQSYIMQEYIMPQLRCDELIKQFHQLIESTQCQRLDWTVLTNVVSRIIENKYALAEMCKINTLGFKESYQQHFIEKRNTFILLDCPLSSMCGEFVMKKWH
jgi:hypothetical protein